MAATSGWHLAAQNPGGSALSRQDRDGFHGIALVRHDGELIQPCHKRCYRSSVHVHVESLEEGRYQAPEGDVWLFGWRDGVLRLALGDAIDIDGLPDVA